MLSFPLPSEAFFAQLPIMDLSLDLPEAVELSRLGSGELLTADLGARLWSGHVTLGNMTRAEIANARALINSLRPAGRSFLAYDTTRPFPLSDPTGALLGAATPLIASLPSDNRTLSILGLPAGYQLSAGDLIGWTYGNNPVRYALHEITTSAAASDTGLTDLIDVEPFIRPGIAIGAAVTLIRAPFKAVLIPGSVTPGTTRKFHTQGLSFALQQSLR
jgi:hypothetical protein